MGRIEARGGNPKLMGIILRERMVVKFVLFVSIAKKSAEKITSKHIQIPSVVDKYQDFLSPKRLNG